MFPNLWSSGLLFVSVSFFAIPTLALPTINDDLEALRALASRQNIDPQAIRFTGWEGCSDSQQSDVNEAWKDVLMLGKAVNMDVDWKAPATRDFFGSENNNQEYQFAIQAILKNIETWRNDGTILAWQIHMRCDDYLRRSELSCPGRTKPEWENRCNSRCWTPRLKRNPDDNQYDIVEWIPRAAAYTTSTSSTHVGIMNWCPGFFAAPTCNDAMNKAVNDYPAGSYERLRLKNYECRGYIALHELFHIDEMPRKVTKEKVTHIYDRKIKIRNGAGQIMTLMAYGPQFTKAMAKWTLGGGFYVATNADNLAQYALAVWATSRAGDYPKNPMVPSMDRPISAPERGTFAVYNDNGVISLLNDTSSIINALGVSSTDVVDLLEFQGGPLSCSDAGTDATPNGPDPCNDDAVNAAIELVADMPASPPTPTPQPPQPTASVSPARPADFNCSCGESGCTPESMGCCANGSCACHCTASGCAAGDPVCCDNGSCKPLPT
ncbi:hypothetical protein BCR34DRAFT_599894 [Clohesyomyces aquaticus]|uniref:Uncharacterized protein n=1 Tax=Clohesyomyces aquaticus TaxID=1231657 RepID=A0A1Y1ZSX2_9PLEO|nr:hypothetical protein BCR34DRAFT_599894 [Clohesyomyces aquaticus]